MKKLEKFLLFPIVCHAALLLGIVMMQLMKNSLLGPMAMLDLCGVIVTPMFYAVLSIANAILYDGKVMENFVKSIIYIACIGVARIIVYAIIAPSTIMLPVGALLVSVAIFSLWEALFALTDKMMKRKRKGRKMKK